MNKTVTANINGIVFHIEVDAYESLNNYLNKVKGYFNNSEERDEIMSDIEARIAELFTLKINEHNQVIKGLDVDEVIEIMGRPEQYINESEEEEQERKTDRNRTKNTKRRVFRDPDDRIIGGVSSGLSAYFGIDTVWMRLFFVIALFTGFGFFLYFFLWLIIPEATTTSEKLEMKGEPINLDNIGKKIEEEAEKLKESLKDFSHSNRGRRMSQRVEGFLGLLFIVIKGVFKVLGKLFGLAFSAIGVILLILLISFFIGINVFDWSTPYPIFPFELETIFNSFFISEDQSYLAIFSILLVVGTPILALIYSGVKLFFNIRRRTGVGMAISILFTVGIITSVFVTMDIIKEFDSKSRVVTKETLPSAHQEIILTTIEDEPGESMVNIVGKRCMLRMDKQYVYFKHPVLRIKKSDTDSFQLKITKYAYGDTKKSSLQKTNAIEYTYSQTDNTINFDSFIKFKKENKIRAQQVKMVLYVPVGKIVYLDPSMEEIIYDIDNASNTTDSDMLNEKWVMLKEGLTCLDCDEVDGITSAELAELEEE